MPLIYPDDPFFGGRAPNQSRRGTLTQVNNYVPAEGEIIFATDTLQVFVGDGETPGGHPITASTTIGTLDFGAILTPAGFTLDMGTI